MEVTLLNNQTLLDIALQVSGKAENFLKIAMANDLVPTDQPVPGTVLEIPEDLEIDEDIVRYYKANNVVPATALSDEETQKLQLTFLQKVHKILKG